MILKNQEKKDNNRLEIKVESDAAEFADAIKQAYLKNKNKISIPGFRKGKAPMKVIEGFFGSDVFHGDALDELAQTAFNKAVDEGGFRFIGMPQISDASVSDAKTALYTFIVELYPEVKLGQYKGIEVTKPDTTVSDEDVDKEIEKTRKQNARLLTVEDRACRMGDTVNIDFEGSIDGVPFDGGKADGFDLELGSGQFIPGFEEQVAGMSIGDEKDINVTFPEDYSPDMAGKDAVFHIKLNGISAAELPALDDEFAKDVSEFDTLAEYKADVKKNLEKAKEEQGKAAVRSDAITKAADLLEVVVPETMIRQKMEEIVRNFAANYGMGDPNTSLAEIMKLLGLTEETMQTVIRPSAEAQTKSDLLIEAVVKEENIDVTDDEVQEFAQTMADSYGATKDDIINYFGVDFIKGEKQKDKAIDLITDSVVYVDAPAEKKPAKKTAAKKTTKKAETAEEAPAEEKPAKKTTTKKTTKKAEE